MDVLLGNTFPAPQIPREQSTPRSTDQVGNLKKMARRVSRKASLWLANRPTWSPCVTTVSASFHTGLTSELEGVRREMRARTGVDIAIGAARIRGVARTASRFAGEGGVLVVAAGQERAFLAPLPLHRLDGVSNAAFKFLNASGLTTIGELQRVPKAALQAEFGQDEGLHLWRAARGMDCDLATEQRVSTAGGRNATLETRLLRGLFRAPWRSESSARWAGLRPTWLRKVRMMSGAPR
jgi:nucleotidyltransferase/DNA polymerase involved in DNA repair